LSLFKGIRYYLLADKSKAKTLKEILGFYPGNLSLYEQAFTHKSIANEARETREHNERLEFLGDAMLGAVIADFLFIKYPFKNEGFLTKMRAKIVSRNFLNKLAIDLGLDTFLETSADTQRSRSIYGDAFEAMLGAIYLDKGFVTCKKFLTDIVIKNYIDLDELMAKETDYKSRLIEFSQKHKKRFNFHLREELLNGYKYYHCDLSLNGETVSHGSGNSKKKAEQAAAREFFNQQLMA
jgi:ribonuclease-3